MLSSSLSQCSRSPSDLCNCDERCTRFVHAATRPYLRNYLLSASSIRQSLDHKFVDALSRIQRQARYIMNLLRHNLAHKIAGRRVADFNVKLPAHRPTDLCPNLLITSADIRQHTRRLSLSPGSNHLRVLPKCVLKLWQNRRVVNRVRVDNLANVPRDFPELDRVGCLATTRLAEAVLLLLGVGFTVARRDHRNNGH